MRFQYNAKRNLATGHSVDTEYEIVMFGEVIDPAYKMSGPSVESHDGTIEKEFTGILTEWHVRTDLIDSGQETENFLEFLSSVGANESFTFDPESETAGVDVAAVLCVLRTETLRRTRPVPGHFQYTFRMREI